MDGCYNSDAGDCMTPAFYYALCVSVEKINARIAGG
jgi:hypothetical protein